MLLTSPLMLLGLLALPALAAVYWLRRRSRRAVVSSLMLWTDQRSPRQGGRILHRMQTPFSFFLELLAITLLVMAAAGPALRRTEIVRPLVVVLDDSYSMLAHGDGGAKACPRERAEAALDDELRHNNYLTRFILAGAHPRLAGGVMRTVTRREIPTQWTCQAPSADLPAAVTLAAEVGGPTARILVLTDHAPATELAGGQTQWWAFGSKLANMAFTAATRSRSGENERVLLEVTNLSDAPGTSTLTLEGGNLAAPRKSSVELAGGAARQFFLNLPAGSPPLRATLDDDALQIDNQVVLLAESTKPLRVSVDLADANLRRAVSRALKATAATIETAERPELVICDKSAVAEGDAWRLEILGSDDAAAYSGPFVIDHSHALTQGLSLRNAIWSASAASPPGGLPIITAGNVSLLSESADLAGRRSLRMPFVADASNLQDMPDWPIFFANLVQWRRNGLPGIAAPNVRLGQTVLVALPPETKRVEVVAAPDAPREIDVRGGHVAVPADHTGLHAVKTPAAEYQFSCNAVSRDESDLAQCQSGRWGDWANSPAYEDRRTSLSWILLLGAMAAMAGHLAVIAKNSEGNIV